MIYKSKFALGDIVSFEVSPGHTLSGGIIHSVRFQKDGPTRCMMMFGRESWEVPEEQLTLTPKPRRKGKG